MKKLLSIAILAAAFTFTSCGNKPADANAAATTATTASTPAPTPAPAPTPTPAADNSLSGRTAAAICGCPAMKELADLMKEMDAVKDAPDKVKDLQAKMTVVAPKTMACTAALQAEANALSPEDKKKMAAEMEAKIAASCPELMFKR